MFDGPKLRTVSLNPTTGAWLGELPDNSPIRTLQELHFNLLAGETGKVINGVGALCLLTLCATGVVIWWRGSNQWRKGLVISPGARGVRLLWELHGAVGIWTVLIIALWATTALSFTFPKQFRAAVAAISPPTTVTPPPSDATRVSTASPLPWETIIRAAQESRPDQHIARVVLPARDNDAVQVQFAREQPTPTGQSALETVYVDRYSGAPLAAPPRSNARWATPSCRGSGRCTWVALEASSARSSGAFWDWAPGFLFIAGATVWWRRTFPRLKTSRIEV